MKEYAIRLKKNVDLKKTIEEICLNNNFETAIILSAVGSLNRISIRLAKAQNYFKDINDYEIVSLVGTVSKGKAHLHISFCNEEGKTIGGHLKEGCLVNTTVELVLGVLEEYESYREFDQSTGYDEIVFRKKD